MTAQSYFGITVDRVCRVRGSQSEDTPDVPLDNAGFLDASASLARTTDELQRGALVHPSIAVQVGALVLLGEPGIGKSTVFEKVIEDDPSVIRIHGADLTELTFDSELEPSISAVSRQDGRQDRTLTIVFDQLDESPYLRQLPRRLKRLLQDRDASGFRFLLACRTADYPAELTEVLREIRGECFLADLAPLTMVQAAQLAASVPGVDGDEVITAAIAAGAGSLASIPLTLEMLVRVYRERNALDLTPREIFEAGVEELVSVRDGELTGAVTETTAGHRVIVASRAAARLLLSGRRTIWVGRAPDARPQDLVPDAIVGGNETLTGGSFGVSLPVLRETLSTALFTGAGSDRLGFRHSSIAAYLAARYLKSVAAPRNQLETLLFVASPDDTRRVPTSLRETAAWLVTLSPTELGWMVEFDVETFVGHTPIVDSNDLRALIVDALLRRAHEIELGDLPWSLRERPLHHPRLATQVIAALDEAEGQDPSDWSVMARTRLAIRLARAAGRPGMASRLLDLADSERWIAYIRQQAALAAYETEPSVAVPRLRELLGTLADPVHAQHVDPDDELRGSLLEILWPEHLSTVDVLPYLRPRLRDNLFGSYLAFERLFPERLPEEDVGTVLRWAQGQQSDELTEQGEPPAAAAARVASRDQEPSPIDDVLLDGLIDRALSGPTSHEQVPAVARLFRDRLMRYEHPPMPAPLDLVDTEGEESELSCDMRRALAVELVRSVAATGEFDRGDAWHIIDGWSSSTGTWHTRDSIVPEGYQRGGRSRLLTTADFEWAYSVAGEALDDGDEVLANAMAEVTDALFDPLDIAAVDRVYSDHEHPVWRVSGRWFDPVELESERAERMREAHGWRSEKNEEGEPWEEADSFAASLNRDLMASIGGDTDAFWRLAWNLQFDPSVGRGRPHHDDNLQEFPGVRALQGDVDALLLAAAEVFLRNEHDGWSEWFGTDRYQKRAWAGYLALALLSRHNSLEGLPVTTWRSWVGALVWFHAIPMETGSRELKVALLHEAATRVPEELSEAAAAYLRGELARGRLGSEIELVEPRWAADIADTWMTLIDELSTAVLTYSEDPSPEEGTRSDEPSEEPVAEADVPLPERIRLVRAEHSLSHALDLWESMLASLMSAVPDQAVGIARAYVEEGARSEQHRLLAMRSARVLLQLDAEQWWPEIRALADRDLELSRSIALACAGDRMRSVLEALGARELGDVYRWLASLFVPEEDPELEGTYFVGPELQARQARDRVLHMLGDRASKEAVLTLIGLVEEFPDRLVISSNLLRARSNLGESAWSPPEPEVLAGLLGDRSRRLVRSEDELRDVVLEMLAVVAEELPAHCELLWDRIPGRLLPAGLDLAEAWVPKPEAALCAYLTLQLRHKLERRGVVANREVLVQPTNAYGSGERTDILVEAPSMPIGPDRPPSDRAAVVIEVKGSWNDGLMRQQRDQLANRYLPDADSRHGIYLVGWYPLEFWDDTGEHRRQAAARRDREEIERDLVEQAAEIRRNTGLSVSPMTIRVDRPASAAARQAVST